MIRKVCALSAAVLATAGCSVTATDIPLPGGGVQGETYHLTAQFANALNLPEKAHVKLDGVDIGAVDTITVKDYTAIVVMDIQKQATLPDGTTAELRQATPLGDVFVALHPPEGNAGPPLRGGAVIPVTATSSAASVEDTLAALSALINGGGLGQLRTIVKEVNTALDGREDRARHLVSELNTTLSTLNQRTADIDRILTATDDLADTVHDRRDTVDAAFRDFTPAIKVLADQTDHFTETLGKVADAGDRSAAVLNASAPELKTTLRDLDPVLDGFNQLDGSLGPTLNSMLRFSQLLGATSRGENLSGAAVVTGITGVPGLGGSGPALPDLTTAGTHVEQTLTGNLMNLIRQLGSPR